MSKRLLFVIAAAMVIGGLCLLGAGLISENEINIWYLSIGGWLVGLGGDLLWVGLRAPFLRLQGRLKEPHMATDERPLRSPTADLSHCPIAM